MTTVRDILLRRKAWVLAVQALCYFALWLAIPVAMHLRSLAGGTKLAIAIVGSLVVILAMFLSTRWVRCPRCAYNMTRFGLRRKEKLQVNVCAHCGLVLDGPVEASTSQ